MNPEKFQSLTGYLFKKQALLEQALTHRSFSRQRNNERLEFLGDSILNLIISNHIYHRFGNSDEGDLSRLRASLVKADTLAEVARNIGLGEFIHLGGGEMKSGGHRRSSILSDALEAVIAAVYLDSDYAQTEKMLLHIFQSQLEAVSSGRILKDPKTRLQEYLQAKQIDLPDYQVEKTTGKSHDQVFTVRCDIPNLDLTFKGSGSSRKKAEQQAAQKALKKLDL
ncbi:MAG: ribonuclease III [Pseudomonadota bacterium]